MIILLRFLMISLFWALEDYLRAPTDIKNWRQCKLDYTCDFQKQSNGQNCLKDASDRDCLTAHTGVPIYGTGDEIILRSACMNVEGRLPAVTGPLQIKAVAMYILSECTA